MQKIEEVGAKQKILINETEPINQEAISKIYKSIPECPEGYVYYIKDDNNNYETGYFYLKKSIWMCILSRKPVIFWHTKEMAAYNLFLLQELTQLAGFDLKWEVVCAKEEVIKIDSSFLQNKVFKVPEGKRLETNRLYNDILWKYGKLG